MKKRITTLTILVLFTTTIFFQPIDAIGSPAKMKEIEKDRQEIQQNLSKKEKEIVQVLEQIEGLHEEIAKIEKEIEEQDQFIRSAEDKVMAYEEEFEALLEEIMVLDQQIEARAEILNQRLAAYQEVGGDISYLEVLFNSKSFIDFISRVTSITTVTDADRQIIEQQKEDREAVEELHTQVGKKLDAQQKLLNNLKEAKKEIKNKEANLKEKEKQLKNKETALNKEKEQLSEKDQNLQQLESAYRQRMEAKKQEQKKETTVQVASTQTNVTKKKPTNQVKQTTTVKNEQPKKETPKQVGKTLTVTATAYTPHCKGCDGVTSTGINLNKDKNLKIIAVDKSVIPLGTKVYVPNYGIAVAGDTGGAIKGNRIDVLFYSKEQARQWGRKTITIKILD